MDENWIIQSERRYPTSGLRLNFYSIYKNPLAHPTVMMRRKCVDSGFLYDIKYKKSEDLEYWLRLKNNGFFYANVQDFVLKYRTGSDLYLKRKKDNWKFNFKARLSNFSFRSPITCLLGITISYIYTILPSFFIRTIYKYQSSK